MKKYFPITMILVLFSMFIASFADANPIITTYELLGPIKVDRNNQELIILARACPPYFFGSWISGSEMRPGLSRVITTELEKWKKQNPGVKVRRISFSTQLETSWIRSSKAGNRCTGAESIYSYEEQSKQSESAPSGKVPALEVKELRIGVRNGYSMISEKDSSGQWNGAAIIFANELGKYFGIPVRFIELNNAKARITAVQHDMVDVVISLISFTSERAKQVALSESYFETGIIAGSLDPNIVKITSTTELNQSKYIAVYGSGTTAESIVAEKFSNMTKKVFSTTIEAYKYMSVATERAKDGATNIVFFTDEVIGLSFPGVLPLTLDGKRLLTKDTYVVAAKDRQLIDAINAVIKKENIPQLYKDLVGR